MTIWDFEKYKNNIAIWADDYTKVTYAELMTIGMNISSIAGRGLVVSLCDNTIGSLVGYVSFLNHQIVPLMLNVSMDAELLEKILVDYDPEYIWCPTEKIDQTLNFKSMDVLFSVYDYSLLKTNHNSREILHDALALLLTTSGSTGSPKFVRQSYNNIFANTKSIVDYLKLDASEKPITTLPMNYTYGLSIINSHLYVGATILLTNKSLIQKEFWEFFKNAEATSFGGVPYTYEILKKLRFMKMQLPSLRTMTQAGGKLSTDLHKQFAEYAISNQKNLVVMYGQCEATARMGYLPPERVLEKCGSMGIAIPGGEFWLVDENDNIIQTANISGELVYKGDNVTMGYATCRKDLAKGNERNGILKTGDLAKKDEDGYYYIVGRKKRFLKVFGNRVNLDELDLLIKEEFKEIECASTGLDDHIFIFINNEADCEAVKDYVVLKTKLNAVAFKVIAICEIPKNSSGKIEYKRLEKYYE